jgi:hypothetical protein
MEEPSNACIVLKDLACTNQFKLRLDPHRPQQTFKWHDSAVVLLQVRREGLAEMDTAV